MTSDPRTCNDHLNPHDFVHELYTQDLQGFWWQRVRCRRCDVILHRETLHG